MPRFVVHRHHSEGPAGLHDDLRLEMRTVLKCWAIPKLIEPASNSKRLAIKVKDHALDVIDFEGEIPEGEGKGTIYIWDFGVYKFEKKPKKDESYKIKFYGDKLRGVWVLRRFTEEPNNFLFFKGKEAE